MHKVLAALGLAVAVPVALAAPALAKPPVNATPSVSSVLRQHEGFRAEVTYLCSGLKHQEGTINVLLQQPAKPGASNLDPEATAPANCDGKEREVKIKIPVAKGALQADQTVQLYTTLAVNGHQVATHTSPAEPVSTVPTEPTPSPTSTESKTPSPTESESPETETPSPSESETTSPTESESPETETPSPSESESETASPSPSPTATS